MKNSGLTFGSKLLLFAMATMLTFLSAKAQQPYTVTGSVTEDIGGPLPGTTIIEKGTTNGTTTDFDGNYSLTVSNANATLVFTFIGYETQEINISGQSVINAVMIASASQLDEVVLIGYGAVKKKDLTGAIAQVDAAAISHQSTNSVTDVLRANVAGLSIGFSADPKGVSNIQIRGNNSLNAGSSPLIVVDGIIYNGDLSDINPADIDKLDVMKDASSAAVYGARGANGVILVTTKRGSSEKPVITINSSVGIASEANKEKPYSAEGYVDWRTDVFKSINVDNANFPGRWDNPNNLPPGVTLEQWFAYDGSAGDPTRAWLNRIGFQDVEIENFLAGNSINWYDKIMQTGFRNDVNLSISGREEGLNYYWSVGRTENEGIVVGEKFETIRSRLNLDAKINDFLTVGMNVQFAKRDEGSIPADRGQVFLSSPWGSQFDSDGNLSLSPQGDPGAGATNAFLRRTFNDRVDLEHTFNSRIYAKVKLPLGFSYEIGYTNRLDFFEYFNHSSQASPNNNVGSSQRWNQKTTEWQLDNILRWDKTIGKHTFNYTFLLYAENFQTFITDARANTFEPDDSLGFSSLQSGVVQTAFTDDEESTGDAFMSRLSYNYDSKYLVTATLRRDGYSAFGTNNKRAYFPSISGAWSISEEDFFNSSVINFLKLRASYGENGNRGFGGSRATTINADLFLNLSDDRGLGRYAAQSELSGGKYLNVDGNGNVFPVATLNNRTQENNDLQWERTRAVNLGLDFSLFQGKIEGAIDAYRNVTDDLIVTRQLPSVIGFDQVFTNLGEIQNKGLEIAVTTRNVTKENFTWSTNFNFSLNRNRINKLFGDLDENGNELDDITNRRFIGQATDVIWDFEVDGVWQVEEADQAAQFGLFPGDFKLIDRNGDGVFTDEDKIFQGNIAPQYRWAMANTFTFFKNIDFSFEVYSSLGQKRVFNEAKNRNGFIDRVNSLQTPFWTPENRSNEYARLFSSDGSAVFNIYRRSSFVRLNNVTVAYRFPQSITDKLSLSSLRIYANARNLAVWSPDWDLYDPEGTSIANIGDGRIPTPRFFTLGVDISL
ncbi:SusC/RagA family TonB-linked outer membrane protein [Arenibacter sp. GZD96]|uniref:SusC/RagA family TonB-linked outer membrane protein n=1 Tax=Aurantibrevibacter litoralis TaxID=3106030 RepID=UPI002AFEAAAB|nr:SusC/RagA family TonB-linked outer membrane protein [Arenibacter sp. GZD-96]MEA1786971.1 SusC/RagA family TonB-linked outer membrane protein [Arenibacter sp. GZD-96]